LKLGSPEAGKLKGFEVGRLGGQEVKKLRSLAGLYLHDLLQ